MPRRAYADAIPDVPRKRKAVDRMLNDTDVSFQDDEALPPGLLMTDIAKKTWRIGKPIGRGSFGRIYLASDDTAHEVTRQNARYVVKIEPHSNGPLFVEIHALIRGAAAATVKEWRMKHKQKSLGMPIYIASGSFVDEDTDTKYRFLVLPRYEIDLEKIIQKRGGTLDLRNVLVLAVQILDVLEYLHREGYTHSDIKSSNLMVGFDGMKFGKVPVMGIFKVRKNGFKRQKIGNSSYYNDDDYVVKCEEKETALFNVRNRMRKMLSDRQSRNLHRHTAFNLRQLSNQINYEDLNSSICSDESYQCLIDKCETKPALEEPRSDADMDVFNEAILSQSNGQIYLLDYGLASKFLERNGKHKEFGMDARKAHDGTLEYSSRDSHIGAHSRRSDLETLGFNLLDWLTGVLPWKNSEMLAEPEIVHALKKNYMDDVKTLLKTCFKTESYPAFLETYLQYVANLGFKDKPDYEYVRGIFRAEFARSGFGGEKDMRLSLNEPPKSPVKKLFVFSKKLGRKNTPIDFAARHGIKKYGRENIQSVENELKLELLRKALNTSSDGVRKPCTSRNFFVSDADLVSRLKQSLLPLESFGKKLSPKNLRSKKRVVQKKRGKRANRNSIGKFGNFLGSGKQYSWAEILAGNPENWIKKKNSNDDEETKSRNRKISSASDTSQCEPNAQSPLLQRDYLHGKNPTYAMREIHTNFRKKMSKKPQKEPEVKTIEGYTPAMMRVIELRDRREAKEKKELAQAKKELAQAKKAVVQAKKILERKSEKPKQNLKNNKNSAPRERTLPFAVHTPAKERPSKNNTTPRKPQYPTPVRRVLESKRKPVVRLEDADIQRTKVSPKKTNATKTKGCTASPVKPSQPLRRTVRFPTNQRVTRSALKRF